MVLSSLLARTHKGSSLPVAASWSLIKDTWMNSFDVCLVHLLVDVCGLDGDFLDCLVSVALWVRCALSLHESWRMRVSSTICTKNIRLDSLSGVKGGCNLHIKRLPDFPVFGAMRSDSSALQTLVMLGVHWEIYLICIRQQVG